MTSSRSPLKPVAIAVALANLAFASAAHAVVQPPVYIGEVKVRTNAGTIEDGGTTGAPAIYTLSRGSAQALSKMDSALGGSVDAQASANNSNESAYASGILRYDIVLTGPAGDPIPVRVLASGYADGAGLNANTGEQLYQANVRFQLSTPAPVFGLANTLGKAGRQSFVVDTIAFLRPNAPYQVELFAQALSGGIGQPVWAEAFVDPIFTIDPAFAHLYSLVGVPTAAAGAVPEPATWAMAVAGFGLVGATMRRRRRYAVTHEVCG
jgi:hypothetical protein